MKKELLLLLAVVWSVKSYSQTAYYDAIHIGQAIENNLISPDHLKTISSHFGFDYDEYEANKELDFLTKRINDSIEKNYFLKEYTINSPEGTLNPASSYTNSSGGGLSANIFADAMARFMIERAKSELTLAFFDRFQKFLEDNPNVKILFPETCDKFENILSVEYRQMLNVLRNAFQKDLDNLPEHMLTLVENIAEKHDILELSLAIRTLEQVKKLDYLTPVEFMNQLPTIAIGADTSSHMWYKNVYSSLQTTKIFSNALRDTTNGSNWISSQDFYDNIMRDSTTFNVFLGLVYQQMKNEKVSFNGKTIGSLVSNHIDEINWYKEEFYEFVSLTEEVETAIKEARQLRAEDKSVSPAQVHSYISTTLEIANFGTTVFDHYKGDDKTGDFKTYLSWTEKTNDIYQNIYEKQYSSAIMESVELLHNIYDEISGNRLITILEDNDKIFNLENGVVIMNPKSSLNPKDRKIIQTHLNNIPTKKRKDVKKTKSELISNIEEISKTYKDSSEWIDQLTTYGVFMANLVDAKTVEEAQAIIESVALPVGSSSIKKNSNFSIGVSSYLGARYADDVNTNLPSTFSVYAPIGIDLSTGFGRGGSLSLNMNVFDIGAIVDYRLTDDSTAIETKISWGNILSPGVNVVYGFPFNWPLALGAGVQYGPGLTMNNSKLVINAPKWTFGMSLTVDIPLINLYNSPRDKKQRKK